MELFKTNIINTFGNRGKKWLQKLPTILNQLQKSWHLLEITPVKNMTYHYVGTAVTSKNRSVVIKIGFEPIQSEATLLSLFKGDGYVRLLDYSDKYNALLLERVLPGNLLKSYYPKRLDYVIDVYAAVVQKIDQLKISSNKFPTISKWLTSLDRSEFPKQDNILLQTALLKRTKLINSMTSLKLLHGDLHLNNILKNNERWLCIDPKGVIGELEFEIAAFDIFAPSEIKSASKDLFLTRIDKLAKKTKVCPTRLRDWFFVRLILSAVWSIEDKAYPKIALKLAYLLLEK